MDVKLKLSRFSCGEGEVRRIQDLCRQNIQQLWKYGKSDPGFRELALYISPNYYAIDVLGSQLPVAVKVFFVSLLFGNQNGRDMRERLEGYIEPIRLSQILREVTVNPPQDVAVDDSALCVEIARQMGEPSREYRSTYGQLGFILHATE
jgi:hypothetical protein